MTDLERVRKAIDWLIYQGYATSRKGVAELAGYKESSFSQILTGKVNLSPKFIKNISNLSDELSEEWILSGEGCMLKSDGNMNQNGNGDNSQQGRAGHDLTQTNNSKEIFDSFIEALKGQQELTMKSMEQINESMKQTNKALDEISEHRKQADALLEMLKSSINK